MPLNLTASERIDRATVTDENGCWIWQRYLNPDGYGKIRFEKVEWLTHRLSYTVHVGPIPEGLVIDHLCSVRSCCNPAHLEATDNGTNLQRGSHPNHVAARNQTCTKGHPITEDSPTRSDGRRRCRVCINEGARRRRRMWANAAVAIHLPPH